ncbi:MAG: hypothetical protein RIR97_1073 [Pseudomonadota bacterium]|jgi:myo-inositol-1(or 4)-monophosphatase
MTANAETITESSASNPWEEDLRLILDAARLAGDEALRHFRQSPDVWYKNGGSSPVSAADIAANNVLRELLHPARPAYGWLSEENEDDESRLSCPTVFVVDPIDGTRAFLAGKPTWCVSVAVVHQGRPVAGVLVAPALKEEFQASLTGAARKNDIAITVSGIRQPPVTLAVAEDTLARLDPAYRSTVQRIEHVPSLAYRLAMIADGRIDGTIVKRNSHDWDIAAADLILQRAGGKLLGLDAQSLAYNRATVRHGVLCAASSAIMPGLLAAVGSGAGH